MNRFKLIVKNPIRHFFVLFGIFACLNPATAQEDFSQPNKIAVYLKRDIMDGEIIRASDLEEKLVAESTVPGSIIHSASAVVDHVARHKLSSGQIISGYDIQEAKPETEGAATVLTVELKKPQLEKFREMSGDYQSMNSIASRWLANLIDTKYEQFKNSKNKSSSNDSDWYWGTSNGNCEELGFVIQGDTADSDMDLSSPDKKILFAIIWKAIVPLKIVTSQTKNNQLTKAKIGKFEITGFNFSKRAIYTVDKSGKLKEVNLSKEELDKALSIFYKASDTRTSCSFEPLFKNKIIPQLTNFE